MQPPDFFLLRTPLLSIERILNLLREDELAAFVQDELVREALELASPSFYRQLRLDSVLANERLQETALKYMLRMGTRCTPFGLFAGCTVGELAQATTVDFSDRQIRRHYRLDMQVLSALTEYIGKQPTLRDQLRYWPNSTLYTVGSQIRYTETIQDGSITRRFISQLDAIPSVLRILELVRDGATITELTCQLTPAGCTIGEAQRFVEQLINDQVLVSELTPHLAGLDLFDTLLDWLSERPGNKKLLASLRQVHSLLHQSTNTGVSSESIRTILEQRVGLSLPFKDVVQCDCFFDGTSNQISQTVIRGLEKTLLKLSGLSQLAPPLYDLDAFKKQFFARFEEREVPLAIALDSETGVGYGSKANLTVDDPLIQDLVPFQKQISLLLPNDNHSLMQLFADWTQRGAGHLQLTDQDLITLCPKNQALPESYYAFGYFLATSAEAIDRGEYRFVLNGLGGPSAFNLMGRFCPDNIDLAHRIATLLKQLQENDSERIYAEVTHLPSSRAGNVLRRAHLYQYEIPYLNRSTLPIEQQILLSDLVISVPRGERIVLRSKRLGKEVIPRLTTAHNHQTGLPIYRFLGDLQQQDGQIAANWHWGPLANVRRLPRVVYQRIILQEARWRLDASDWVAALSDDENVNQWQAYWQIPSMVAIVQADHELFLDLSTAMCRQLLVSTVRRLKTLTLIEWLRTPDNCWIMGPDGKLTHEVVLPFTNRAFKQPRSVPKRAATSVQRTFLPGSEWLYLKVYCGHQTVTRLIQALGAVAQQAMRNGLVTHWFFVRYQDPEAHLRIRFHLSSPAHQSSLLTACQRLIEPISETDDVFRIQVDTYQREIERYGGILIELTEWLFWTDSKAVYFILKGRFPDDSLFSTALLGIDSYLTDFCLSNKEKINLCQHGFKALFDEHGASAELRAMLARKYRLNESTVIRLLNRNQFSAEERRMVRLFKQRSRRNKPYLFPVLAAPDRPGDYLLSLIHLFINRLFSQRQRTYELLLYHHLTRAYQSQLAQQG